MDDRSESFLVKVHPDLCKIMRAASQKKSFMIVYGIRTLTAEQEAMATGHSETLHSRHLPNKDGLSCAVDVAALMGGKISFATGYEPEVFGAIAAQIKAAAEALKIPLQWGGDPIGAWVPGVVSTFRDWGHFQLPWAEYP